MNKFTSLIFLLLTCFYLSAQDIIILKHSFDTIHCKISQFDSVAVYYYPVFSDQDQIPGQQVSVVNTGDVYDFKHDISLNDLSKTNQEIQKSDSAADKTILSQTYNSYFNIGTGIGFNYGLIGIKGVLGWKNTGLLFSAGVFGGKLTGSIGFQAGIQFIYINVAYGAYRLSQFGDEDPKIDYGIGIHGGGMINLTRNDRLFLEMGVGYIWGNKVEHNTGYFTIEERPQAVGFNIGINYRF